MVLLTLFLAGAPQKRVLFFISGIDKKACEYNPSLFKQLIFLCESAIFFVLHFWILPERECLGKNVLS